MIVDLTEVQIELGQIINSQYIKTVYADLTKDEYHILELVESKWTVVDRMYPTEKVSEWFEVFSNSTVLHDEDRDRFRSFTNLDNLKRALESNSMKPLRLFYRRKINDDGYKPAIMEIIPSVKDNGNLVVFIFVKNVSATYDSISKSVSDEIKKKMISKSLSEGKKTALVVEDNEINREILCDIISDTYDTLEAENGKIGLEVLRKNYQKIAVILLDVQMPVMNGYEFMEEVSKSAVLNAIPIIVLTANEGTAVEEKCLALGASDYIKKPYNPVIVQSRIASLIRLRESISALLDIEYDELTKTYTKEAFYYHAERVLDANPDKKFTMLICDIQQYLFLKRAYGEEYAQTIIVELAEALKQNDAPETLIGRTGEDVFAVLSPTDSKSIQIKNIEETFAGLKNMRRVNATVKCGIYENVDAELSVSEIYSRTSKALDYVKHQYNVKIFKFDDEFEYLIARQNIIEMSMEDALRLEQFVIYFQPKHRVRTGEICGAEALIRWKHPVYGFMEPNEFIPVFENTGFICDVDKYVWKKVCEYQRQWLDKGLNVVPVSVNQSRMDFVSGGLFKYLKDTTESSGIPTEIMHLEITESLFAERMEEIRSVLEQCKEYGFKIELDDFGAGYSSLNVLGELPLDVVKMDMSFMKKIHDPKKVRVLEACIKLAHSLNLDTVCEGVENEEHARILQELEADSVQGYLYSKPIPAEEFEQYLIECAKKKSI